MIRRKKRQATDLFHSKLCNVRTTNPKEFWKTINKTQKQTLNDTIPIDVNNLGSYFSELLKGPVKSNYNVNAIPDNEVDADLDSEITEDEFRRVLSALNVNKAPGFDDIPGIIFKSFTNQLTSFTVQLFNQILTQENYPESWGIGIIKPLYKKGNPKNPKNYRGITLLPIIGKLFSDQQNNIMGQKTQYIK